MADERGGVQLHLRKAFSNTGPSNMAQGPLGWTRMLGGKHTLMQAAASDLVKARINSGKTRLPYKALTRKGARASGSRAKMDI